LPEPRVALGQALLDIASASLDISDGLVADLGHIAATAAVRVVIDAAKVPLSQPFQTLWASGTQAVARAATAGDDYELAFTAAAGSRDSVNTAAGAAGVPVTEIGRCEAGQGVVLVDQRGREIRVCRPGYVHF